MAGAGEIDSFMHVIARAPELRVHLETICGEHLWSRSKEYHVRQVRWQQGKVFDLAAKQELIYYHLHDLKREPGFYVPDWPRMPAAFMITRRGACWIGEQRLAQRLATAARRQAHFCREAMRAIYRLLRWKLRRAARALMRRAADTATALAAP